MTRNMLVLAAALALLAGTASAADAPTTGTRIKPEKQEAQRMDTIVVGGATRAERAAKLDAREAARAEKPVLPTVDATQWAPQAQ